MPKHRKDNPITFTSQLAEAKMVWLKEWMEGHRPPIRLTRGLEYAVDALKEKVERGEKVEMVSR